MPHLFNHWEIEGSTDYWANSVLSFLIFFSFIIFVCAQAPLDTTQSFIHTFTPHWRGHSSPIELSAQWKNNTGERQFTGYKLRLMARNDERQGSLAVGGRGRHAPLEIYRPP